MIEPLYFGKEPKLLFGIYYPPRHNNNIDAAIVFCSPIGQEYMRSHRTFLHLVKTLALNGLHVLKFDYYGCGDSAGKCEEGNIDQWILDILEAIDELKEGSGAKQLYLIGLRLGATLALLASNRRSDVDGIVLWEPIVSGINYIDELRKTHHQWLNGSFSKNMSKHNNEDEEEILGFPLTNALKSQLRAIDLLTGVYVLPANTLLIESSTNKKDIDCFRQYLNEQNEACEYVNIPAPQIWVKGNGESKAIVPLRIVQYISEWLTSKQRAC